VEETTTSMLPLCGPPEPACPGDSGGWHLVGALEQGGDIGTVRAFTLTLQLRAGDEK
jgi:hypothetical protein